jgi:thiamine-monophosphate kinase
MGDAEGAAVRRSGARAGDDVLVTGPCGGSAAGLRVLRSGVEDAAGGALGLAHRRPVALIAEGMAARQAGASAMIDISDGLALDLHRMADASGVGFELDEIPVAEGATLEEALGGGEDYELLITMDPIRVKGFMQACLHSRVHPPIRLGRVTKNATIRTLGGAELARSGWQHHIG